MAGMHTVLPEALPAPGGAALLAGLAATLVASLLAGLRLSRGRVGAGEPAARPDAGGRHAPG